MSEAQATAQATAGPALPNFLTAWVKTTATFVDKKKKPPPPPKTIEIYSFSFLGIDFATGVNEKLRDKLIQAQVELYRMCQRETKKAEPTKEEFALWCWDGQEPVGDAKKPGAAARLAGIPTHGGFRSGAGFHASGSAIDINVTFNPFVATRTGNDFGGEAHDIPDGLLRKIAPLPDAEFEEYKKAQTDGKSLSEPLRAKIDRAKRKLLTDKVWKPGVECYDRAHSLFLGTSADVSDDSVSPERFDRAAENYKRFFRASQSLKHYFAYVFDEKDRVRKKGDFNKLFTDDFNAKRFHPDAVGPNDERLIDNLGSAAKAAALIEGNKRVEAARAAKRKAAERAAARKSKTAKVKADALKKAKNDETAAQRDKDRHAKKASEHEKKAEEARKKGRDEEAAKEDEKAKQARAEEAAAGERVESARRAAEEAVRNAEGQEKADEQESQKELTAADEDLKKAERERSELIDQADERAQADARKKAEELSAATKRREEAEKNQQAAEQKAETLAKEAEQARQDEAAKKAAGAAPEELAGANKRTVEAERAAGAARAEATKAAEETERAKADERAKAEAKDKADALSKVDPTRQAETLDKIYEQIKIDHQTMRLVLVTGKISFADDGTPSVPGARDPCRGFLNIRQEVVEVLIKNQKLRWVGCMAGCGPSCSGDMMHFDLNEHFIA